MDANAKHPIKLSPKQLFSDAKRLDARLPDTKRHECTPKTNWVKTGEICQLYGVYPTTVRKWEQTGRLKAIKTPAGQRLYDLPTVQTLMGQASTPQDIPETPPTKEYIIYCRVSSSHQKDDLQRQREFLSSRYPTFRVVQDVGAGLNLKRKGLQTILDLAIKGNLGTLVVPNKDRLCRFGFELIEYIINNTGGTLLVLDHQDTKPVSSNEELAEDLLSIITVFNCRQMGRRRYKKHQDLHQASDGELSEHS